MIKHHIWKLRAPVQPFGHQPSGSGLSKPYYGNYVQPKCNRLDTRATSSRRGLVMEAFSAILERRLQLTVRTLSQAVRIPSGILVITFYANIGLGRNCRRWKANKKFCKLIVWKAIKLILIYLCLMNSCSAYIFLWHPFDSCLKYHIIFGTNRT
jgi:hypothetical protein